MDRAPGKGTGAAFVRGKSGNVPFWPGGLDVPTIASTSKMDDEAFEDMISGRIKLKTVPPGFRRGMRLKGEVGPAEEEGVVFEEWEGPKIREARLSPYYIFSLTLCLPIGRRRSERRCS